MGQSPTALGELCLLTRDVLFHILRHLWCLGGVKTIAENAAISSRGTFALTLGLDVVPLAPRIAIILYAGRGFWTLCELSCAHAHYDV